MNILAMDTSGPVAGVALWQDGRLTHEITAAHGLTHSQTIMPMVDQALSAAGLRPQDIDRFAAVVGPGSFTGVRIGVCSVKALAHATGKPCVAVDALEALAAGVLGFQGCVCPILDARRQQVYCAAFECAGLGRPQRQLPDAALPLEAFLEQLPKEGALLFVGDGAPVYGAAVQAALGERAMLAPGHLCALRAGAAAYLASLPDARELSYLELEPLYLRAPQAERERLAREASHG